MPMPMRGSVRGFAGRGVVARETPRETAQQFDEAQRRFPEGFFLARENAETRKALADFERQGDEQLAAHVIAHHRLRQHRHRVVVLEQLQRREDRRAFGEIHRRSEPRARELFLEQHTRRAGHGLRHPWPVDQFAQRDARAARERMHRAHHEQQGLARKRLETEIVMLQGTGQAPKREIDFAAMQQLHHLVAGFAEYAHAQQRTIGLQRRDGHGQQIGRGTHDRADRQLTVTAAALDLQVFGETREFGECSPCIGQRHDAKRRGCHAARVALEQQKAERFLDVAEHAARARLRDVDGFGGLMEIACVVERDEQREVFELEPIDECDGC